MNGTIALPTLLLLATSPSTAAAQVGPDPFAPSETVVEVYSGHGQPGQADAEVTVLAGPLGAPFAAPFTAADFAAADAGPPAFVVSALPWGFSSLSSEPAAQWIATHPDSGLGSPYTESGLYSIGFELPPGPIFTAWLELTFGADDYLGYRPNEGLYLNGQPVPGSRFPQVGYLGERKLPELAVANLLVPGENRLYVNAANTGGPCGVMFHARLRINAPKPEECSAAFLVGEGTVLASNNNYTTSPAAGSCGMGADRWYAFVPGSNGTLRASTQTAIGGLTDYAAAVAVFTGNCDAPAELGCDASATFDPATGTVTSQAQVAVPVQAGVPYYVAVGGAGGATGTFALRLTLETEPGPRVNPANGHTYALTPTAGTWSQARAYAASVGTYLVSIGDAAEDDWLTANFGGGTRWIGFTDEVVEGSFAWESGEPVGYTDWGSGQPDDWQPCGGEDYASLLPSGLWNDLPDDNCGFGGMRGIVEDPPPSALAVVEGLGPGCSAGGEPPALYASLLVLGQSASLAVLDAAPERPGFLFASTPPAAPAPVGGGCSAYVDPASLVTVASFTTGEFGSWAQLQPVPNNPALVGFPLSWQAVVLGDALGSLDWTEGLRTVLGF